MKRVFVILLIITLARIEMFGQGEKKFQIWTDFNPSYKINENWQVSGDVGYRIEPSSGEQAVYVRPAINYNPIEILKITVGLADFNNWELKAYKSTEIRTFQFINLSWPKLGEFKFKHRLGLEQRWFYLPSLELDEFIQRARYYLEIVSPDFKLFGLGSPFYITANFEILRDANNNELGTLADHNRYTLGIGNKISKHLRGDVRFKIINLVDPVTSSFVREIEVIRFRIYYQFASS